MQDIKKSESYKKIIEFAASRIHPKRYNPPADFMEYKAVNGMYVTEHKSYTPKEFQEIIKSTWIKDWSGMNLEDVMRAYDAPLADKGMTMSMNCLHKGDGWAVMVWLDNKIISTSCWIMSQPLEGQIMAMISLLAEVTPKIKAKKKPEKSEKPAPKKKSAKYTKNKKKDA